jgi:hypothetical protein
VTCKHFVFLWGKIKGNKKEELFENSVANNKKRQKFLHNDATNSRFVFITF